MSLGHDAEDLALKSPVITDEDGLRLLMSLKRFSKLEILCVSKSNASLR